MRDDTRAELSLEEQVAELPAAPGVYIFRDCRKKAIYIGKANSLKVRVRQYLVGSDERMMVPFLLANAKSVESVVTQNEKEALLLENELIKRHQPRYNVNLRDDKNFLHLRIDLKARWPRYELVRRTRKDGATYFGPYTSAARVRKSLAFLHRVYPLRTCSDSVLNNRARACLLHQMGRCVAPCVQLVGEAEYRELVEGSTQLLRGQRGSVLAKLKRDMLQAAVEEDYERAAVLRDLMQALEATLEAQGVVDPRRRDRDIWGLHRDGSQGAIVLIQMREGTLAEPKRFTLPQLIGGDAELLSTLINTWYQADIPPEIILPVVLPDEGSLAAVLSVRADRKVKIQVPQRGERFKLLTLAQTNAKLIYVQATDERSRHEAAMAALAKVLEMEHPPTRIECFDNSNLQGANPVAAMAVFVDGKPVRSEYRRYKVKTVTGADDYATMREILGRRFRRAIAESTQPDLVVVDGGKGQLGVAQAVLEDLGVHGVKVIGIAKPKTERRRGDRYATDKLVLLNRKDPLRLPRNHPALRILQHIRDEVHNHAIRYHRKVRRTNTLQSVLEMVPGVGPKRRKQLLRAFGSAEAVAVATEQDLAGVPGIGPELARTIRACLTPR
jgi:excinuclease ABC subunit C